MGQGRWARLPRQMVWDTFRSIRIHVAMCDTGLPMSHSCVPHVGIPRHLKIPQGREGVWRLPSGVIYIGVVKQPREPIPQPKPHPKN